MAVTGAGLEGIIAAESSICYIDGQAGILSYNGYNIHTLAENATFEEVIFLLWNGRLPNRAELDALKAALVENREIPKPVESFLGQVPKGSEIPSRNQIEPQVRDVQSCQWRQIGNLRADQRKASQRRCFSERRDVGNVRSLQV